MAVKTSALSPAADLIAVDGRLDQNQNDALEEALSSLLADGRHRLVVDLSQTNYINSGGLRILVAAWRQARQHEGDVVLCGLNDRLQEIFSMVGFDKVFHIYPSVKAAQASL